MGFFKKLFKKNSIADNEWDELTATKDDIDMSDPYVREQYVLSCLEQMHEASKEIDRINEEYSVVTSYLTDMEEIEALSEQDKKELEAIAKRIGELRKTHDNFVLHPGTMSEEEFERMSSFGDSIADGIKSLKEAEDYNKKVKADLKKISKEREAYKYRRKEVYSALDNTRGIATISMVAAAVLVVILFALQKALYLDVSIGYYLTIALAAVTITVVYLKYKDYENEKKRIEHASNELILLENKVKIRYVNNKNLLDYLCAKYETDSSEALNKSYEKFLKEREDRKAFERNEASLDTETAKLLKRLRSMRINDPEVWLHQTEAIVDKREMVEVRHNLIARRQKLRKRLEYNEQIAIEASDEVKDVMKKYPKSAPSLMELINKYEKA